MSIGIYMRLSQADGDFGEDGRNESNSIDNQRLLLTKYVNDNPLWENEEVIEYVDDGFTGTNFNRPAFMRMIEDAKKGIIKSIIVKDFSRLGRDYITAGDYIDQVFPMLGIRFIAVNNHYDSAHETSNMGFDMAVNNLVNTFYSRDMSQKMQSAFKNRWRQGYSTFGGAPFGYVMDPDNKGKMKIDPEAAAIVRRIFDLALEGKNTRTIAQIINGEGYPTPSVYNRTHKQWALTDYVTPTTEQLWNPEKVLVILKRYTYTGALVMGMNKVYIIGSDKVRQQPRDKWTIVEGAHESIVSVEEFERAQLVIKKKKADSKAKPKIYPLKGKLRCGTCRRRLRFGYDGVHNHDSVVCQYSRVVGDKTNCYSGRYSMKTLEKVTLDSINNILELMNDVGRKGQAVTRAAIKTAKIDKLDYEKQMTSLKEEKVYLYERYAEGYIPFKVYEDKRQFVEDRIKELEERRNNCSAVISEQLDLQEEVCSIVELGKKYIKLDKLTYEAVQEFIDCIYVYDPETVEIHFLFEDVFKKLM